MRGPAFGRQTEYSPENVAVSWQSLSKFAAATCATSIICPSASAWSEMSGRLVRPPGAELAMASVKAVLTVSSAICRSVRLACQPSGGEADSFGAACGKVNDLSVNRQETHFPWFVSSSESPAPGSG